MEALSEQNQYQEKRCRRNVPAVGGDVRERCNIDLIMIPVKPDRQRMVRADTIKGAVAS